MFNLAKPLTGKPAEQAVLVATHQGNAAIAESDSAIAGRMPPTVDETPLKESGKPKLSRLIDHDFPFDESQIEAIQGLVSQKFGCMTGAAGTGKTTCTKKLVDDLQDELTQVDMSTYFKREYKGDDPNDDYEAPEQFVPSICLCAFTGRASQMIKKNFPRDWHGNIMTIHRMLGFMPEFYEDVDEETGDVVNKMRFVPTYNSTFKLPWDVIVIDEAGMVGLDLWNQLLAACKDTTRIYMIGDINQLPPTHGRSVFGFAMTRWPSWELTHIHRQKGVNNSIVDNAWLVLKGQTPKSDDYKNDPDWKFALLELPGDSNTASRYLRAWLEQTKGKIYDPIRDTIITPINAYEQTSGYALGQDPLNRQLALMFNAQSAENPRYIIDAGRERKYFAVGDKVMATRNDHEAGITNGMTGIITGIARNGAYQGDTNRFDTIDKVNEYLNSGIGDEDEGPELSLEDLAGTMNEEPKEKTKESRDRGPASHIVTIRFGEEDHAFELQFSTLAEVASLMTAYVVTCHKMQGGEAPVVIVIVHHSHKRMLFREWLYTAITRASHRCIILYTRQGLATALNKQNIRGVTLAQKVEAFQKLQEKGIVGAAVKVNIPDPESTSKEVMIAPQTMLEKKQVDSSKALAELAAMDDTLPAEQTGIDPGNPELPPYQKAWDHQAKVDSETVNIFVSILTESKITINEAVKKAATPEVVDGGDLDPLSDEGMKNNPFRDVKMATYGSLEYYRQKEENRQKALEKIDSRKNQIVAEQSAKMLALSNYSWRHPIPKPMEQELRESQVLAPAIEPRSAVVAPQPIRSTFKLNLVGLKK
jgi:hypothetical protein